MRTYAHKRWQHHPRICDSVPQAITYHPTLIHAYHGLECAFVYANLMQQYLLSVMPTAVIHAGASVGGQWGSMARVINIHGDDTTPLSYPWCIAWRVMDHLIVWLGNCVWSYQEVLVGFKLFMLPFYKYTSTTSAYWIQTDSISVNLTYDMISFECFVTGILVIISTANGFYLPGLAPVNYCKEGDINKSCKVTWSYYLVEFLCTWRTRVMCDE